MNKALLCAALAGIMTAGVVASAHAADAMTDSKVKCYGIAKAGKNGCKSANASHSCAGQAKTDNDPNDWMLSSSADACTSAGGKIEAK